MGIFCLLSAYNCLEFKNQFFNTVAAIATLLLDIDIKIIFESH
jgi:hypothetical protein